MLNWMHFLLRTEKDLCSVTQKGTAFRPQEVFLYVRGHEMTASNVIHHNTVNFNFTIFDFSYFFKNIVSATPTVRFCVERSLPRHVM